MGHVALAEKMSYNLLMDALLTILKIFGILYALTGLPIPEPDKQQEQHQSD